MDIRTAVGIGFAALALVGVGSFLVSPTASTPEPVEFDRTVSMGMTLEERRELGGEQLVTRTQIAYSQYPYVVGYRGIELAADAVDDPLVEQQFGYPRAVYVESAPPDVRLDEDSRLIGEHTQQWIPASDAHFVVGSGARTPSGATSVAFASESRAAAFASEYGGRTVGWSAREQFARTGAGGAAARNRTETQSRDANETVAGVVGHLNRTEGPVVGADEPTLRAALAAAEPNTTVRLPPGTYNGPVTIDESVTLAGENATITGNGNGTVVNVRADDVAITGVSITGVGESIRDDSAEGNDWDRRTEEAYGYSDAGITAAGVDRVLVHETHIETPASGVVLRDSNGSVVDGVTVAGADEWEDGFMGVVAMRSPAVVQRSTFIDGRDGVYTHRASGATVRNNRFFGGRFGVHLMYTSDALIADNCARGQELSGVVIMTNPSGTAIVDNVISDTAQGISTSGFDAYVARNIVVGTEQGISTSARNSLYTDNVLLGNDLGFRASAVFPTSVVVRNDVVDNGRHVRATTGPLRVWTDNGEGNYWSGAETLDRSYSPTDPVDGRLHRGEAARTLSAAPVVTGLRAVRSSVPGMRGESVVDTAPRVSPVNPTQLDTASALNDRTPTAEEPQCVP